jgi:hypothetical protein
VDHIIWIVLLEKRRDLSEERVVRCFERLWRNYDTYSVTEGRKIEMRREESSD